MKTTSEKLLKNEDDLKKNERKNEDDLKKQTLIGCDIIVN